MEAALALRRIFSSSERCACAGRADTYMPIAAALAATSENAHPPFITCALSPHHDHSQTLLSGTSAILYLSGIRCARSGEK